TIAKGKRETLSLLREKLVPVLAADAEKIAQFIADLESPNFKTREAAMKSLSQLDWLAAPAMQSALKRTPSAEARQRLTKLLDGLSREPTAEEIHAGRAVKALELSASPEARAILREWAAGAPGARLTEDAKSAMARLSQ